jgi:tetratricopeptide (TPR) repeat protein
MPSQPDKQTSIDRLDSWKAIAAFFGRDERTVKRWEKRRGLPVHRLPGGEKGGVFAYPAELSAWLESARETSADTSGPISTQERPAQTALENGRSAALSDETEALPGSRHPWQGFPSKLPGVLAAVMSLVLITGVLAYTLGYRHRGKSNALASPASSRSGTLAARPPDAAAHDLYLKGRYYWSKRTPDDLDRAVDCFTQAIARDPGYAQAYMGLADSYNLLREYSAMPPSEAFPRALAAARKAVELDPSSAEAHTSLAFATFYWNWDAGAAEREFKRAIELDPHYETAHHWYATFLMTIGRLPEAVAEIERARDLNPTSAAILADQALILFYSGQPDRAIGQLRQLESAEPAFASPHRYLAMINFVGRDYRGYLAELTKQAQLLRDPHALAVARAGAQGYAGGDPHAMLQAMLAQQKRLYQQGLMSPYYLGQTSAMLGTNTESLRYLQSAVAKHEPLLIDLRVDPLFNNLHGEPDYQKLLSQVGLPPLH